MNLLLRLVDTPYFLYLEDDWLALDHALPAHVVDEALEVFRSRGPEPIVQVLLNDQASRSCAYAAPEGCPDLGGAGWPRETPSGVSYRLHDFGTVDPRHAFTYWPGVTLNPAVWDVRALACVFEASTGAPPAFDPEDPRFEQSFSLAAYDAGVRVAYLPRVTFAHTGVDESAYGLMNVSRPWDGHVSGGLR